MLDLAESKLDFIREISTLQDEDTFMAVVTYYSELKIKQTAIKKKYARSIRKKFDPEMLKRKQGYKGHDRNKIMGILQKIEIPEPIEAILAQLKS